jgi:plasmid stabilization system protein ParE
MSMAVVRLLPDAYSDVESASDWYAGQSRQAAERFEENVEKALGGIALHPELYAVVTEDYRICPIAKSSYQVVYFLEEEEAIIIAVVHGRRVDDAWKSRRG